MSVLTEEAAETVRSNFQRLSPAERRELLRQLIAELDLPQRNGGWANEEGATHRAPAVTAGSLLEWLEEGMNQAELETVLRQYLPDFNSNALTDAPQRALINQRLSGLGPVVLYDLHQQIVRSGASSPRLTPDEIVARTWGTISGVDREVLREIIEDEDYCGY